MTLFPIVRVLAYTIWSIVGLILWIPFLVRSVMTFNGAMIFATVTRDEHRLHSARERIDTATVFYLVGFRNIQEFTTEDPVDLPTAQPSTDGGWALFAGFLLELCWTGMWWSVVWNHKALFNLFTAGEMSDAMFAGIIAFICGGILTFAGTVMWASKSR
jgi:hypothetical protein